MPAIMPVDLLIAMAGTGLLPGGWNLHKSSARSRTDHSRVVQQG
jgi:hypothetical protein